jgi:predicted dehydrogenase
MDYAACDTETALVRFQNGAHVIATANANVRNPGKWPTSVEIYGTEGSLLTDPWSTEPVTIVGVDCEPIAVSTCDNTHLPMIDDFTKAVSEGRKPQFDGTDGMWATAIIAGAYESSETGQAVTISI